MLTKVLSLYCLQDINLLIYMSIHLFCHSLSDYLFLYAIYLVCVHSTAFHVVYKMALKTDVEEIISQIMENTTIKVLVGTREVVREP